MLNITPKHEYTRDAMNSLRKLAVSFSCTLALMCASTLAYSAQGVTDSEIVIGQSAGFTGTAANEVKQATAGAQAYFDLINQQGGVNGRKIVLKSLDDGFDPKRTVANTTELLKDDVFSLFLYRGTPTTEAALPLINDAKIPLIAPVTGALSLRTPMQRYVFTVRTTYRGEVEALARQIISMGLKHVAVLVSDDSFGKDALTGLDGVIKEGKLQDPLIARYERNSTNVGDAVNKIFDSKPNGILMICTAKSCDAFVRQYRAKGGFQPIFALSNVSSPSFINGLGDLGRGLGITQVFPDPRNTIHPISKEFQQVVKGNTELASSYPAFEGFISAKVLVEGLRGAGRTLTREKLVSSLERLEDFDLGGLRLHFSPTNHSGLDFVELTVVGRDGMLMR